MPNILLINYEYPPIGAGAANATHHMAGALVDLGAHPIVVTAAYNGNKGETECNGISIIRIPALRAHANKSNLLEMASYLLSLLIRLPRLVRQYEIDSAIIYFSFPCGPIGLILRLFYGIRYIVSLRGGDVPGTESGLKWVYWLLTPLRRLVLNYSDANIANSAGLAALSKAADPQAVTVVPNGVDTDFWRPLDSSARTDKFVILFVGRLHGQKNPGFLLTEFAKFQKTVPTAQLTMVGDGPEKEKLVNLATTLGINNYIIWRDWLDKNELKRLYQISDCLVNPSLYEGMPNVLLEAMASGTPVLASDVMGNHELVSDGVTGFLFELGDSEEFQRKLAMIHEQTEIVSSLRQNARDKMVASYSWTSTTQQYLDILT